MGARRAVWTAAGSLVLLATALAQRPFREYPGNEYENFPIPPDWQQKTEWAFARLMYPPAYGRRGGFGRFGRFGDWTQGSSSWTTDYPRSDRHVVQAVRRLTRVHVRSVEQPVNLDDGDQYDWPWLYAVRPGEWKLSDAEARAMREYLLRGGFFMADDFWGSQEWEVFLQSLRKVFPDRQVVDIPNPDALFHIVYDLDDRYRVPGAWGVYSSRPYQYDGSVPYWRGIYDDKGRTMVAIVANSDLGDSWEFADDPEYPEKYSALGIRIGVNYIVYALTH